MQKNRGQRDRDKDRGRMQSYPGDDSDDNERHLRVSCDFVFERNLIKNCFILFNKKKTKMSRTVCCISNKL